MTFLSLSHPNPQPIPRGGKRERNEKIRAIKERGMQGTVCTAILSTLTLFYFGVNILRKDDSVN